MGSWSYGSLKHIPWAMEVGHIWDRSFVHATVGQLLSGASLGT